MSTDLCLHQKEPAPTFMVDRREDPRYRLLQRCFVRPDGSQKVESWRCIAYNISVGGIGITMPYALEPGTLLEIEPWGLPEARTLKARIVHAKRADFLWMTGCRFDDRLNEDELQEWLKGPTHWLPEDELNQLD